MVSAAINTATSQTRRGSARSSTVQISKTKTTQPAFGSPEICRTSGLWPPIEPRPPAPSQYHLRLSHRGAVLELHQPVRDRVFPDRQMRATAPPGFRVGITARGLVEPGEELQRQRLRRLVHGARPYSDRKRDQPSRV